MKIIELLKNKPLRSLVLLSSAASAAFLSFALISQYGFGLHPCELCIAQRYPYALIVVIGVFSLIFVKTERSFRKVAMLLGVLFLVDGGIAVYHAGVEAGIFTGPSACTSSDKPGESLEEMRLAIMNAQLVPCDQPMAHFFGLTMAAWNAVAALVSGIGVFCMIKYIRRRATRLVQ